MSPALEYALIKLLESLTKLTNEALHKIEEDRREGK
jgi:hypothetical protein